MRTSERRLRDLEQGHGGGLFVVRGPCGFDAAAALAAGGIVPRPADLVVSINKPGLVPVEILRGGSNAA